MAVNIRKIKQEDNAEIARIIRATFDEFDAPKEGTAYADSETDHLYELFQVEGSAYFIAEEDGVILGGCGVYPTNGLPDRCAELVKLYLAKASRGRGVGKLLMDQTIQTSVTLDYQQLYIESLPAFSKAVSMYEKAGFVQLEKPLGNSVHFACTIWMLKDL